MIPGGMNPKQMAKMMKRMGVKMEEIPAEEVVIRTLDKEIKIQNPQVIKTIVQGQEMFQVSGEVAEAEVDAEISISDEDVKMVAEQANVPKDKAKQALEKAEGDLAQAIIDLKG